MKRFNIVGMSFVNSDYGYKYLPGWKNTSLFIFIRNLIKLSL
jgi:hypothetical protein